MTFQLIILIALGVAALAIAAYAVIADRQRRQVIARTLVRNDLPQVSGAIFRGAGLPASSLRARLMALAPSGWRSDVKARDKLVQAGFDDPVAPLAYATARLVLLVAFPTVAALIVVGKPLPQMIVVVACGAAFAYILPHFYLERAIRLRQEGLRRSLPDAVDLLVLCVESGLGLDASLLRVARELRDVHPDVSRELMLVNRKVNAGMPREEALRSMYSRTMVHELQILVQNLIQSEKLGSSVAKVLRVYSETLRRKRRQTAERKAAVAPIKMTIPLVVMILPALFVVILGPAMLSIFKFLGTK